MRMVEQMTEEEAREIARMTREELYPLTNPAVLCRAILTLYLQNGIDDDCRDILDWFVELEIPGGWNRMRREAARGLQDGHNPAGGRERRPGRDRAHG
jgi:hypothetical protein